MRTARRLLALAATVLLVPSAGCGAGGPGATQPPGSAGRFVLVAIGEDAVPAVLVAHALVTTEIVADTLWLETDGDGVRHVAYRSTEPGGEPRTYRSVEPFTYTRSGTRIEIGFECLDVITRLASCVAPPHFVGSLRGPDLEGVDLHGSRLLYRRG